MIKKKSGFRNGETTTFHSARTFSVSQSDSCPHSLLPAVTRNNIPFPTPSPTWKERAPSILRKKLPKWHNLLDLILSHRNCQSALDANLPSCPLPQPLAKLRRNFALSQRIIQRTLPFWDILPSWLSLSLSHLFI